MNKSTNFNPSFNFIIGMGRSGTSLLTSILNSHSKIYASPENNFLLFIASYLNKKTTFSGKDIDLINTALGLNTNTTMSVWKGSIDLKQESFTKEDIIRQIYLSSSIKIEEKNVQLIFDKNPEYTLHLKQLEKTCSNAKFLAISRNYRDNISSRKKFSSSKRVSVFILALSWNHYNKRILKIISKKNIFHVRYESLVENPTAKLKEMFQFIGLEYEEEVLNYYTKVNLEKKIKDSSLTEGQKTKVQSMHSNLEKPISTERINVWSQHLRKREILICDVICRNTSLKLGHSQEKEYNLSHKLLIQGLSIPFRLFYYSYLFVQNIIYYELPLKMKIKIFKNRKY